MNRRSFLKHCALLAGSVGALAGGVKFDNATLGVRVEGKRYNVLFVLVDSA